MHKRTDAVMFDRAAVYQYLKDNGYKISVLSKQMGHAVNYLTEMLRSTNPKNCSFEGYKQLCALINVPVEKFLLSGIEIPKEEQTVNDPAWIAPKEEPKQEKKPRKPRKTAKQAEAKVSEPTVTFSADQFNALVQSINALNGTLERIANAQNCNSVISGKIYGELTALSSALGVHSASNDHKVSIRPQYVGVFGSKE